MVYNNDYFLQWSPVTAQDMIDRIPGLTEGGSSRGGFSGRSSGSFGGGFSGFRVEVGAVAVSAMVIVEAKF